MAIRPPAGRYVGRRAPASARPTSPVAADYGPGPRQGPDARPRARPRLVRNATGRRQPRGRAALRRRAPRRERPRAAAPQRARVACPAHRGGRAPLRAGALEVRHLKTLGPLPVLWDRWTLASPWRAAAASSTQLLAGVRPRHRADARPQGPRPRLPGRVADALAAGRPTRTVTVCARSWRAARAARRTRPGVRIVHSVGSAPAARRAARRPRTARSPASRSIGSLLDAARSPPSCASGRSCSLSWPVATVGRRRAELGGLGRARRDHRALRRRWRRRSHAPLDPGTVACMSALWDSRHRGADPATPGTSSADRRARAPWRARRQPPAALARLAQRPARGRLPGSAASRSSTVRDGLRGRRRAQRASLPARGGDAVKIARASARACPRSERGDDRRHAVRARGVRRLVGDASWSLAVGLSGAVPLGLAPRSRSATAGWRTPWPLRRSPPRSSRWVGVVAASRAPAARAASGRRAAPGRRDPAHTSALPPSRVALVQVGAWCCRIGVVLCLLAAFGLPGDRADRGAGDGAQRRARRSCRSRPAARAPSR